MPLLIIKREDKKGNNDYKRLNRVNSFLLQGGRGQRSPSPRPKDRKGRKGSRSPNAERDSNRMPFSERDDKKGKQEEKVY